ncbi:hypothetical protein V6N12_004708 [Hibiscus sabdariffa]|uniref:Uncharacterized protein n=1 Tax=Hibiscus sabdariffa TaxID=183260 RepID=A0ABR2CMB2_9ROSI
MLSLNGLKQKRGNMKAIKEGEKRSIGWLIGGCLTSEGAAIVRWGGDSETPHFLLLAPPSKVGFALDRCGCPWWRGAAMRTRGVGHLGSFWTLHYKRTEIWA